MQIPLNIVVRAVIVHEGRLLVSALDDGKRDLFYFLLGGHVNPDETMTDALRREIKEEINLDIAPLRLLYVSHNFFMRNTRKLHEMAHYFLCSITQPVEGDLLSMLTPDLEEFISPELVTPSQLIELNFQPAVLKLLLAQDAESGFKERPKLVVINELPGDVRAEAGIYGL